MNTTTLNESRDENARLTEAAYLVDRALLLHLWEKTDGSFGYAVFDKQTGKKTMEGKIGQDILRNEIDFTHNPLAAARMLAIRETGLNGVEMARVGLTFLKKFPTSDVYRRAIWEPDTLPKNDIRFINSGYDELFRIPDGGTIQVEYPDRTFSARCEYIDDYHAYIGGEVYHICQFAEILERSGGACRPEPMLETERAAWKIGWRTYLTVARGTNCWDYHLYDEKFHETRSDKLEIAGCSISKARNMILAESKLARRSMTPESFELLTEKAAIRAQEAKAEKRESVQSQLSSLNSGEREHAAPERKQNEPSL